MLKLPPSSFFDFPSPFSWLRSRFHYVIPINNLYAAPLLSDNENGVVYGKTVKITDTAIQRLTTPTLQRIPFHCLYCYRNPAINAIVKLANYDQLTQEFPDYDAAVVIHNPLAFLKIIELRFEIYANYVKYSDRTPLQEELTNDIHCLYYKREEYREQNEFRIALPQLRIDSPTIYQIGSLSKVAYCVPLKHLKHGVIMAENEENFRLLRQRCEALGYGVGDGFDFEKSKEG